jgi:hypothetical protein
LPPLLPEFSVCGWGWRWRPDLADRYDPISYQFVFCFTKVAEQPRIHRAAAFELHQICLAVRFQIAKANALHVQPDARLVPRSRDSPPIRVKAGAFELVHPNPLIALGGKHSIAFVKRSSLNILVAIPLADDGAGHVVRIIPARPFLILWTKIRLRWREPEPCSALSVLVLDALLAFPRARPFRSATGK